MTTQKKDNKKGLIIILFVLCGILIAGNVFQFISGTAEIEVIEADILSLKEIQTALNKDVDEAHETVKSLEGDNAELNEEVAAKLAEIERIKVENDSLIKSGLGKAELNRRLRANLALVRKLNKELENKVDELLLENKKLETENTDLKINVDSLNTVADALSSKVAIASTLNAEYIKVSAFKKKRTDKYRKTKLAKRTNKIELTCKIMKNTITENGEKKVFLKLSSPEGKTLGNYTESGNRTDRQANGSVGFADFKSFSYTGEEQELVLSYETEEREFPKGNYLLEVMIDGQVSGTATFSLK
jgi:predicted RNase H-like nuclease (RuvC/YqgF family)